jgi:hypothetical protein
VWRRDLAPLAKDLDDFAFKDTPISNLHRHHGL